MKKFKELLSLFLIGGLIYGKIEIMWRGYTHLSMILLGGFCFVLIGLINEILTYEIPLLAQGLIGSCAITTLEFLCGYILNIVLQLNVWDYSEMKYNIMGQICLLYSILWIFISIFAVILDDWFRYFIFDEEKPHYTLF